MAAELQVLKAKLAERIAIAEIIRRGSDQNAPRLDDLESACALKGQVLSCEERNDWKRGTAPELHDRSGAGYGF